MKYLFLTIVFVVSSVNVFATSSSSLTESCLLRTGSDQESCSYPYGNYEGFNNYDRSNEINELKANFAMGFWGCYSSTSFPVYSNSWGLGCINKSVIPMNYGYSALAYFLTFTWSSEELKWVSNQHQQKNSYYDHSSVIDYRSFYPYNIDNSYKTVIAACDTSVVNSCGPDASCLSLGSGSVQNNQHWQVSGPGLCILK